LNLCSLNGPQRWYRVFGAILLILTGCSTPSARTHHNAYDAVSAVELYRGECFWGTCPSYKVKLGVDGQLSFTGLSAVPALGERQKTIAAADVQAILATLDQMNYFSLSDRYTTRQEGCKEVWSDAPAAEVTVTHHAVRKTVLYYFGCRGGKKPEQLSRLIKVIEDRTGIADWIDVDLQSRPEPLPSQP
jgi:hypothetical protein